MSIGEIVKGSWKVGRPGSRASRRAEREVPSPRLVRKGTERLIDAARYDMKGLGRPEAIRRRGVYCKG